MARHDPRPAMLRNCGLVPDLDESWICTASLYPIILVLLLPCPYEGSTIAEYSICNGAPLCDYHCGGEYSRIFLWGQCLFCRYLFRSWLGALVLYYAQLWKFCLDTIIAGCPGRTTQQILTEHQYVLSRSPTELSHESDHSTSLFMSAGQY